MGCLTWVQLWFAFVNSKDVDEKLLKPEPGEIVSVHDYELNQAVAFLKTRGTAPRTAATAK